MIFAPPTYANLNRQQQYAAAEAMKITGLAAPYNALSTPHEDTGIRWRFARGCFARAAQQPCTLWGEHSGRLILADTANATLQLRSEHDGLHITATLPWGQHGFDCRLAIGRGILNGISVGFDNEVERIVVENGVRIREITYASLREISLVRWPRFRQTYIRAAAYKDVRECDETHRIERFLFSL